MEYRKYGEVYYIRMDRGDEIIENFSKSAGKKM
jgi:predicted DNA-binding protein with PD1-like motif